MIRNAVVILVMHGRLQDSVTDVYVCGIATDVCVGKCARRCCINKLIMFQPPLLSTPLN